MFREENDNENNETREIELPDGTKKTINKCSQIMEWIYCFKLNNNEDVKNKLKDYLNQLLTYKNN